MPAPVPIASALNDAIAALERADNAMQLLRGGRETMIPFIADAADSALRGALPPYAAAMEYCALATTAETVTDFDCIAETARLRFTIVETALRELGLLPVLDALSDAVKLLPADVVALVDGLRQYGTKVLGLAGAEPSQLLGLAAPATFAVAANIMDAGRTAYDFLTAAWAVDIAGMAAAGVALAQKVLVEWPAELISDTVVAVVTGVIDGAEDILSYFDPTSWF